MKKDNFQKGFVLIIALVLLTAMTIIVVGAMKGTTLNERMAGSYMDRNRAYQGAEMALRQAQAVLQDNAEICVDGCTNSNNINGVGASIANLATTWTDTNAANIIPPTGQNINGKFVVNLLPDTFLPSSKSATDCSAYSILGRGSGISNETSVILQTIAFVCSL
jgi:type IV pilus assembly protein PilX